MIYATAGPRWPAYGSSADRALYPHRSVYALTVNLSGCPPVEQISHSEVHLPDSCARGHVPVALEPAQGSEDVDGAGVLVVVQ